MAFMQIRTRGYLPHLEETEATYFVTFRLEGSLPQSVLQQIAEETKALSNISQRTYLSKDQLTRQKYLQTRAIQQYLDRGLGECWLSNPLIADTVSNALHFFNNKRYESHAFSIMPNHVHWLFTPVEDFRLARILHGLKSYTANEANKILQRAGRFWEKEYYDHMVRDVEQFGKIVIYILENPVKAGLCNEWSDWKWSWCSEAIRAVIT